MKYMKVCGLIGYHCICGRETRYSPCEHCGRPA